RIAAVCTIASHPRARRATCLGFKTSAPSTRSSPTTVCPAARRWASTARPTSPRCPVSSTRTVSRALAEARSLRAGLSLEPLESPSAADAKRRMLLVRQPDRLPEPVPRGTPRPRAEPERGDAIAGEVVRRTDVRREHGFGILGEANQRLPMLLLVCRP